MVSESGKEASPERHESAGPPAPPSPLERAWVALGPIVAAALVDLVDLVTPGMAGIVLGALLGTPLGWWLARRAGVSPGRALALGVAAGVYCAVPVTTPLPLATIAAALARWFAAGDGQAGSR